MRHRILFGILGLVAACNITPTFSQTNEITENPSAPHHTTETQMPIVENTTDIITGAIGPDIFEPGINPLTGLLVADPGVLQRRPIVAKISNAPPLVRPQAGIDAADLVFEHYAEGGLTRFSAVFYSQTPQRIGSLRSARLIDYELLPMYRGLLTFSGASIGVEERLNTSEFSDSLFKGVLYGLPYYWRDDAIPVPHNMFTNAAALWNLASQTSSSTPELHGMAFHADPPADSLGAVNAIDIRYRATRVLWEYDETTGRYRRFADGQGHYDANTLEQITAANVVMIFADHTFTDIVESEWQGSVSYSIEIKLWFEGDAILFRDGQRYDGRWIRPTREDMIALRTNQGDLLYLKPGNTWFQVVRPLDQQTPEEEWLRME